MDVQSTAATAPCSIDSAAFLHDLLDGLARRPRAISPKYFYDAAGSALFDRICDLPEYYPMRTEAGILRRHGADIMSRVGADIDLIEFGAGSLVKVRLLLGACRRHMLPGHYVPIDICGDHLRASAARLSAEFPTLDVCPVEADYTALDALLLPGGEGARKVGFFPGSTIGNMDLDEALAFLHHTAGLLSGGGLLIGVDLVKDPARLHAAYNDAQGITAQFNLNVLARANRELGADFDLEGFAHYALYQPVIRRVEMHLVSLMPQRVMIAGTPYDFDEGDTLHTENSYKYTVPGFQALARRAGYRPEAVWLDEERLFSVHWLLAP
ncbi:L-histidine N(alpha)-methyltransferase [Pusillimonas sp. TS35]|uniref:L-histidine N(alpha)-methyltransferase n=1 Tax=Paracandidimonas lactea TaxID=2895524 RepID=UPI00136915C5|nr:L-histidine N(alpha)-methyltransferase [Paracandidimonas lactea]MYN13078.1 L-histidine N(alpha)-methyltransferase [Pusillimonas sp. TS35]